MGRIIYNGESSESYHILVEHPPRYEMPERKHTMISVPGKNGDLYLDDGSFCNVNREYQIAVVSFSREFVEMAHGISRWLHSASDYTRLEDSYEPDYYRMAIYTEAANIENILAHAGRARITFNCKPQRYYKMGDRALMLTSSGETLYNPGMTSLPLITVFGTGAGSITAGGHTVEIRDIGGQISLNCELRYAYTLLDAATNLTQSRNDKIYAEEFPCLPPGECTITWTGGITHVEIFPRWWTL